MEYEPDWDGSKEIVDRVVFPPPLLEKMKIRKSLITIHRFHFQNVLIE